MVFAEKKNTKEIEVELPLTHKEDAKGDKEEVERGEWGGKMDFLMALISYAVGLGNVWRFPYLAFKNGGGAFLICYIFFWIVGAVPIFFMEVAFGQLVQQGGIGIWKVCPIFRGVGIANVMLSMFCSVYFCVLVAWSLFYMISSFQSVLPWETCDNWWNNELCIDPYLNTTGITAFTKNMSDYNFTTQTSVEQFWERRVLMTTDSIDETGGLQWELVGLLCVAWVIIYMALRNGITHSSKFIYFCALSPYLVLMILFIRGITLPGASTGLYYYFYPDVSKLASPTVWKDAGTQVFYSYGIGFGALVALGSYNKYHHNMYKDAISFCCINLCTSIMAGTVVFSVLGYMSHTLDKPIDQVVKSGVGLAFTTYPEVVMHLPGKQLWSFLFFFMLVILGVDTQLCTVEGIITALCDQFPHTLRKNKPIFVFVFCVINILLALPMVSHGGQYWLTLVDSYAVSGIPLLFIVFFEIIGFSWGFGAHRLVKAIEDMLGYKPCPGWKFIWQFGSPIVCVVLFASVVTKYESLTYFGTDEPYPAWAQCLGTLMALSSMLVIPAFAIYNVCTCPATGIVQKIRQELVCKIQFQFEAKEIGGGSVIEEED